MDRGAWEATVHGVAKSQTRLSDLTSLQLTGRLQRQQSVLIYPNITLTSSLGVVCLS